MEEEHLSKGIRGTNRTLIIICSLLIFAVIGGLYFYDTPKTELVEIDAIDDDPNLVENGIHVRTGFIKAPGMQETVNNCTSCHSAQLVIQNRMDEERWKTTIDWMQKTQGLWDLGENEDVIVNYLAKNYPPSSKGRREALTNIEWYELKD